MKTKTSPKTKIQQRPKYHRPLFLRSQKTLWRVKKYEITLASYANLTIKLRSFTTPLNKRSKKIRQLVFSVHLLGAKEVAISYKKNSSKNKSSAFKSLFKFNFSSTLIIAGFAGLLFFGLKVSGFGQTNPPIANAQPVLVQKLVQDIPEPKKQQYLTASVPLKIDIPSIAVGANIQKVGLLANGTIETPDVLSGLVGWYQYGPTPGELGPSVLVGHVDSYKGPSVFWNLSKLNIADVVNITRSDGIMVQFIVSRIAQYDQDNFLTDEVYGNIDHAGLRIITCGGTFNHFTGHYSQNTVIYADMAI
ncbi:MAG: class F sortase [bacterium]